MPRTSPLELLPEVCGSLPHPVGPVGRDHALPRRRHRADRPRDRRTQGAQDVARIDPGVAADGDHGARPDEDHLGPRRNVVRHLDGGRADPIVQHDDVGPMEGEDARELGRARGLSHDVVALGFQHETQEPHACGSSFAYDDPDPVSAHLPPKERYPARGSPRTWVGYPGPRVPTTSGWLRPTDPKERPS